MLSEDSGKSTRKSKRDTAGRSKSVESKRICVLVVGMHRSGTSLLTGILGQLGCASAKNLMPANFANESGYYESSPVSLLNDQILESAGTNWKDWQPVNDGWFSSPVAEGFVEQAIRTLDDEFGDSRLFVLKDPRICRILPFWHEVFKARRDTIRILHIYRNPLEVAQSLAVRDSLSRDYSLLLWLRHNLEAEYHSRDMVRHFLSYADVLDNWADVTESASNSLGVSWPRMSSRVASEVQEFISYNLKHHDIPDHHVLNNPLLSEWVRDTFCILSRWSRADHLKSDKDRLDTIRMQLDESGVAFSGLLEQGAVAIEALEKSTAQLENVERESATKLTALEGTVTDLSAERDVLKNRIVELENTERKVNQQLAELEGVVTDLGAERDAAAERSENLNRKLESKLSELEQRSAEADHWAERVKALDEHLEESKAEVAEAKVEATHWADPFKEQEQKLLQSKINYQVAIQSLNHKLKNVKEQQGVELETLRASEKNNKERLDKHERELKSKIANLQALHAIAISQKDAQVTKELQRLKDELENAQSQICSLQSDKSELLASTSWRITSPLRRIVKMLRM